MDSTGLNDTKDSGSNHDVFKKKFTSLSRPRQPLREANANLPTLPFKWNKKHSSSYSPPKGKEDKKLSPNKPANDTSVVSPIANKTRGNELLYQLINERETELHLDANKPIEVNSQVPSQELKKNEQDKVFVDETKFSASENHDNTASLRKRERGVEKQEEIEQNRSTAIRRKLSNTDKAYHQIAAPLEQKDNDTSRNQQKYSSSTEVKTKAQMKATLIEHKESSSAASESTNIVKAKDHLVQARINDQDQAGAGIESKKKQHQSTEIPTGQEKTRSLIDSHNSTAKSSNIHSKNSDMKAPLQVIDSNKPDRKSQDRADKAKLAQSNTQHQKGNSRLSGEELYQWQQSWKKIMRESVVFFEGTHDFQSSEYKKAVKYLKYVGSEIAPFYRTNVTIIISKRTYDDRVEYPSNDIFSNVPKFKTKVWSYEKLFRFMKNLGLASISDDQLSTGANAAAATAATNNLYNLLKEEKLYGVADRDPSARRDDFHYFGKNYLYVYDLSQTVRPIAIREWGSDHPVLHLTLDGKCPFIDDSSDQNSERKRLKRFRKFEATKAHRQALRAATDRVISGISLSTGRFNGTSTSTDKVEESSNGEVEFRQPLTRNSSCIQSKAVDTMASGFNGASNAVQFSMDSNLNSTAVAAGNGLGPFLSQVQSKNLNNLKRRIFLKRKTSERRDKESTPGYCENCRCKYDNFEDHIYSNRHRNFACDDRNFVDIDELIATLKESNSMGNITSNGDYI
ncbi:DBF4 [Candida margitis]|uniref:DBF4 n=1 Tax=Candida margitis TaxID=1775924 RepID=UPI002227578C|nr:DBF4 [Candida margitis]KAI5970141.1 DBF4 [Candida margitis]